MTGGVSRRGDRVSKAKTRGSERGGAPPPRRGGGRPSAGACPEGRDAAAAGAPGTRAPPPPRALHGPRHPSRLQKGNEGREAKSRAGDARLDLDPRSGVPRSPRTPKPPELERSLGVASSCPAVTCQRHLPEPHVPLRPEPLAQAEGAPVGTPRALLAHTGMLPRRQVPLAAAPPHRREVWGKGWQPPIRDCGRQVCRSHCRTHLPATIPGQGLRVRAGQVDEGRRVSGSPGPPPSPSLTPLLLPIPSPGCGPRRTRGARGPAAREGVAGPRTGSGSARPRPASTSLLAGDRPPARSRCSFAPCSLCGSDSPKEKEKMKRSET